ncbi:Signal transduction histidine kinase [Amycolatopsis xylanica]|uniref:Signal transduction histidine kinase n=1 Tax=Amycolatopsis xylanica TaxID=589385 RepID=A0A1H3D9C8_9PSEU|nr:histidine kinase [Amycolatopsis xylanica]SDX62279.1 Signal transduction histidine kinase [Amycolatopsis xylanica]
MPDEDQITITAQSRGAAGPDRRPRQAVHLANAIVTVVFAGYFAVQLFSAAKSGAKGSTLIALAVVTGTLVAIQLFYFGRPTTQLRSSLSRGVLVLQALLGYLPILLFGGDLDDMPSFLAGSVLLVLRPLPGWITFSAIVLSMIPIEISLETGTLDRLYDVLVVLVTGLYVYLLTQLSRLVTGLNDARAELAEGAVAEERLRFASDLHDLLGMGLSAIALKGELTHRLLRRAPERARAVLSDMTDIARRTLSDVRSVASGYRELSLEGEARIAKSLLAASDVEAELDLDQSDLPVQFRTVLTTVLREGVTNVLRYSEVSTCRITVRQTDEMVSLDITSDGDAPAESDDDWIPKLTERVEALGGTVTVDQRADGTRLHTRLPLPDEHGASGRQGRSGLSAQDPDSHPGTRQTRTAVAIVFSGMCVAALVHLLYLTSSPWQIALTAGYLAALLVLQLSFFTRPTARLQSRQGYGLLFVQACLIFLPLIQLKANWVSLPGWLAGTALLVLRPVAGWTVFAAVVAGVVWVRGGFAADPQGIVFNAVATVNTGLIVFALSWMTRLAAELAATRRRLAEVAVAEERLRFARDLHDLLGLSLSAIALKTELTDRMLPVDPGRATVELEDVLNLSREALADVRSVATGYRDLSLDQESRSAQAVLAAAEVEVKMDLQLGELPKPVTTVLAVVLREGVTNVLRHSKVEQCDIAVRQLGDEVRLDIVNDGVGQAAPQPGTEVSGNGIRNLSDRVSALGGELTAAVAEDGRFRLRAVVPV